MNKEAVTIPCGRMPRPENSRGGPFGFTFTLLGYPGLAVIFFILAGLGG